MKITIKKGTKNAKPAQLNELWKSIGWRPRKIKKWTEVLSKTKIMFTAWHEKKLIGTGRLIEDGIMCMLYDIGVHPKYQKQGIGTKILEKLINEIKNKKYASIGLFAWKENKANISFYKKHGFEKTTGMELTKYMKPE